MFPGYLISLESAYDGEMVIISTQAGHPLDRKVVYGGLGVGHALAGRLPGSRRVVLDKDSQNVCSGQ